MITIKPVRATRDLDLQGPQGRILHLSEGEEYELHMGDAHIASEPDRFFPCDVYPVGGAESIGSIDQREAGRLIADGSLL